MEEEVEDGVVRRDVFAVKGCVEVTLEVCALSVSPLFMKFLVWKFDERMRFWPSTVMRIFSFFSVNYIN